MIKRVGLVLFLGLLMVSFVSAGNSSVGVEYDNELKGQFLVNDWVFVMVKVEDFSNITIDYDLDSIETQAIKDNQRWETYRETSEAVLSTLSEEEFKLNSQSDFGRSFSGNITKEGFDKLLQDSRIKKIYAKKNITLHSGSLNWSFIILLFLIVLLVILIILIIKLRGRKWRRKI